MLQSPDRKKFHSDTELNIGSSSEMSGEQNVAIRKRKQPDSEWSQAINELSAEFKKTLNEWRRDMESSITKIADNVISVKNELSSLTQITSEIKSEINLLRSEQLLIKQRVSKLDVKCEGMSGQIDSLKDSVQFVSNDQNDICKKVTQIEQQIKETVNLSPIVTELVVKIDHLEQSARNNNIELCNIPERRNENLLSLMQNIGSVIKYNIQQSDIISIHRVPHAHQQNNMPKNIIVKFATRVMRDNILSAHRLCKGLTTEQLGMSGTSQQIYMHEHLTLKNKLLFRECREAAKKHNYKFLWVKHGTILVREKEAARAFAIRNSRDIVKIKPGYAATNDNKQ